MINLRWIIDLNMKDEEGGGGKKSTCLNNPQGNITLTVNRIFF